MIDLKPVPSSPWLRPVDYFVPPDLLASGGDLQTRARILAATCVVGGLMTTTGGVVDWTAKGAATGIAVTNLLGGLVIFLGAFFLRRTGSLPLTANVLVAVGFVMNTTLYASSEGTNLSALYTYSMIPVIAFLIGGPWIGVFWTVASCLTAVVLINGPMVRLDLPVSFVVADRQAQITRDVVVITVWLALVGGLFDLVRSAAQRNAEAERVRTEESERRFALFFEANPDGILMADAVTREILECNDGLSAILAQPRERIIGEVDWTVALGMAEAQRETLEKALREHGQSDETEVVLSRPEEGEISLRVRASQVEIEGRPCVLATVRDVTERARLEAQLRQAQKMEAVGRLAGAIAHDFNNMLTVISGYAEHLADALDDELGVMAGEIYSAADRSADLTRQLLAFSRQQVLEPQILDLNQMIRRLQSLLQRLIGVNFSIELDLAPDLDCVRADPGQVEQVIVNLAINSRDAMVNGGTLRIETSHSKGSVADGDPTHWVCLRVRDTGHGMDEATLDRVCEPFFTTKDPGEGTGLGLSTVEGIVSQSGGELAIRSRPGHGTVVEVFLPPIEGPSVGADTPGARQSGDSDARFNHTILLVEDDAMVRRLASRSLSGAGYRVIETGDGDEALGIFIARSEEIDLVLTDLVMPRRGGLDLARTLRETQPDVPILFMSGYPNPREDAGMALPPGEDLIHKPFSPSTLLARVSERLARHATKREGNGGP